MTDLADRQHWMAVLARATAPELEAVSDGLLPAYTTLRGPEAGLVMLRGRAGGTGDPFNVGEASVVRCTVRTGSGVVGHAYCLGRDLRHAELAAALDAALQEPTTRAALHDRVIAPLAASQEARRTQAGRRAAATRVEFFTMATMRT